MTQIVPHQVSALQSLNLFFPLVHLKRTFAVNCKIQDFFFLFYMFPTPSPSSQLGTQEPSEGRVGCGSCQEEVRWCSAPLLYCTFTSGCRDEPMYRPYCPSWKQEFGCSYVTRPNWPESINSLCQKTCGLCGIVNNIM